MQRTVLARNLDDVKTQLPGSLGLVLGAVAAMAVDENVTVMALEARLGRELILINQRAFAYVLGMACKAAMLRDLSERGLAREEFQIRTDRAGYATIATTFGPVTFPVFAYWEMTMGARVLRCPAKEKLFKHHRNCHSSPLCLEWEASLAAQHPFRSAEQALTFFTRGAVTLEDNTIADHAVTIGELIEPEWFYKKPEDIRAILQTRATRHRETGQPLLYFSTDAHALRRYTDASWAWDWKMANGIRIWCEDAATGQLIHLGGEYLWGGLDAVATRVSVLLKTGILPDDTDAWKAVNARLVLLSDGSEAIVDKIYPLLPMAEPILDPYHLLGWFAEFAAEAFRGKKGRRAREALYHQAWIIILGLAPRRKDAKESARAKPRRGHKKNRRRPKHAHDLAPMLEATKGCRDPEAVAKALLDLLPLQLRGAVAIEARDTLMHRIEKNVLRIDYADYLACGLQIGSGAMESFHRTGSQLRLKIPGAKWCEASSQAILNLRMLQLSGRWEEFWARPDLEAKLAPAFARRAFARAEQRRARVPDVAETQTRKAA